MILLPYRFCGDSHHAFAFPFVLIFLPLRLSCKESSTSNQAFLLRRMDVTALLGARNRYALRLAGHQSPRQVLRDGTAKLLWRSACNYIAESGCMERVSSIDAMKLSISVFFLDYSLSFFISSAGFSTNFCSAWLAVGAMRLFPP